MLTMSRCIRQNARTNPPSSQPSAIEAYFEHTSENLSLSPESRKRRVPLLAELHKGGAVAARLEQSAQSVYIVCVYAGLTRWPKFANLMKLRARTRRAATFFAE